MSTDKTQVKRSLADADNPGKWTTNSEKKSKLAVMKELQVAVEPEAHRNIPDTVPWSTEQETANLDHKLSQPPAETPGNTETNDSQRTHKPSTPGPETNYMTPPGPPPTSSNAPADTSTLSKTAPPTTVYHPWVPKIISALKDLQMEVSSLKLEVREMKYNLKKLQPKNQNQPLLLATPPAPTYSQPKPQPTNAMDIDSSNIVPDEEKNPSDCVAPPHTDFLHKCFRDRIGLSPYSRSLTTITSFDGTHIATGFNRILPTYQGYYVELEHADILWKNLNLIENPDYGEECWHSPGLAVIRRKLRDARTTPQAHRFAIKPHPDQKHPCNPLLLDKYYLHAYQVRFIVEGQHRSLNSRWMAARLNELFPQRYHPRGRDRSRSVDNVALEPPRHTATYQQPIISARTHEQAPDSAPKTAPPQPYLPPGLPPPTGYAIPTIPQASVPSYHQSTGQAQPTLPWNIPRWSYPHQPPQQYGSHLPIQPVPHWQYPPNTFQPVPQLSSYALNPASYGTSYVRNTDRVTSQL